MKPVDQEKYEESLKTINDIPHDKVASYAFIAVTDSGISTSFGGENILLTRAAAELLEAHIAAAYLPHQIAEAIESAAAQEQMIADAKQALQAMKEQIELGDEFPTPASLNSVQ